MKRPSPKTLLLLVSVVVYLAYTLFPIYWLLISSFKPYIEIFQLHPSFFPRDPTLVNYLKVIKGEGIGVNFLWSLANTIAISIAVTIACVLIGGLAGYGMSRSSNRFIYMLPLAFLLFSLTPPQTYAVPLFLTLGKLGLIDTQLGLAIVYLTFGLPFPIWFLSQYFKSVPREFEEVARVAGYPRIQIVFKIVFPLAAPALMTAAIFSFMGTWNEVFFASILTSKRAMTMPVAIMSFQDARVMAWDLSTASSMLAVIPLGIILTILQRYVVQGLTAGGLKE